jgi:hypothetical protein
VPKLRRSAISIVSPDPKFLKLRQERHERELEEAAVYEFLGVPRIFSLYAATAGPIKQATFMLAN